MSEADGRYVNQDGGVKMAKPVISGAFGQGALGNVSRIPTVERRRRSKVILMSEWPTGARRRGWGYIWDEIWYYFDLPCHRNELNQLTDEHPLQRFLAPNGTIWSYDHAHGEWMRLYMVRKMLWITPFWKRGITFRYHTFHSGDDKAAVHTHPWWFVTFPLATYSEVVMKPDGSMITRLVKRFRLHFRRATFRHIVEEPERPFKTLVISGGVSNDWGFWTSPRTFVPYRDWVKYE